VPWGRQQRYFIEEPEVVYGDRYVKYKIFPLLIFMRMKKKHGDSVKYIVP
jgi:hypothetical protein